MPHKTLPDGRHRQLKIYSKYQERAYNGQALCPEIRLSGQWLEQLGFHRGPAGNRTTRSRLPHHHPQPGATRGATAQRAWITRSHPPSGATPAPSGNAPEISRYQPAANL